jgi:hypothetical protein
MSTPIDADVLARLPAEERSLRCICARCAQNPQLEALQIATPAVHGKITTTPYADNSRHDISHTVPFVVQDVGDPRIAPKIQFKSDGHTWKTWTDGGRTKVMKDEAFTYRVQLFNHGGDAVPSGSTVSISEKIGAGVKLVKAGVNGEGTCATGRDVSCSLSPSADVAPGQLVGTLEITVLPTREAKEAPLGPVIAKLAGDPGEDRIPVRLRVIATDHTIRISTDVRQIPDSGGRGEITMNAANLQKQNATIDTSGVDIPSTVLFESVDDEPVAQAVR